ncbi:PD40 domain-containing protein [Micrococcales bacterium 31B]|nr:PD40 domain-containing protein [Micrococcales bacterium 31B]
MVEMATGRDTCVYRSGEKLVEAPNWYAASEPHDQWLCVNYEGLLYRLDLTGGGELRELPGQPDAGFNNDHVFCPSGAAVFGSGEDKHLYRVALDGSGWSRVSDPSDGLYARYLHGISPDGRRLAFVAFHGRPQRLNVFTMNAEGGGVEQLTDRPEPHDGPEYSPSGGHIFYNAVPPGAAEGHAQVYRMRADGGEVTQLTADERVNWFPHVSPDGRWLLYLSYPPGTLGHPPNLPVELRVLDLGEGGPDAPVAGSPAPRTLVSLFGGQGTVNVASWAPDGSAFAYVAYPRVGS